MFKEELRNDPVDGVFVQFSCPHCSHGDVSEELSVPERDWKAVADDAGKIEPIELTCSSCGHKFTGEITCISPFI